MQLRQVRRATRGRETAEEVGDVLFSPGELVQVVMEVAAIERALGGGHSKKTEEEDGSEP